MKKIIFILVVGVAALASCSKNCNCTVHTYDSAGYVNQTTSTTVETDGKCSDGNSSTQSSVGGITVTVDTKCD